MAIMINNISEPIKGSIYVFLSALAYASLPIFAKLAYAAGLSTGRALFFRYLFSLLVLVIFIGLIQRKKVFSFSPLVLLQGVLMTLGGLFYFHALNYLSAGLTSIIFFTHPIFVAILAIPIYKEKFNLRLFTGLFLALAGILILSGTGGEMSDILSRGSSLALLSGLCYTFYSLLGQKTLAATNPLSITATVSLVAVIIFGLAYRDPQFIALLSPSQFSIILAMTFINTLLAVLLFLKGLKKIGASRATLISSAEPALCLIMAYFLLDETLGFRQIIGSLMVFASMYLALSNSGQPSPYPESQTEMNNSPS